jgi:uracil-DNA glycosylase family 4
MKEFICTDCNLYNKCKTNKVGGKGDTVLSKIMVVIDYPDRDDDYRGKLLSGDVVNKIDFLFEKAGLKRQDVYFTAAIKCKPKDDGDIKKKQIEACRKYLAAEILQVRPKMIIAAGKFAHWALTDITSLAEFRGHFGQFAMEVPTQSGPIVLKIPVMPTFSFGKSMFKWEYHDYIIHDLKKALNYLKNKGHTLTPVPSYKSVRSLSDLKEFYETMMDSSTTHVTTDLETTGFSFFKDRIINAGYCNNNDKIFIVPLLPYLDRSLVKKWTKQEIEHARQINLFLKSNSQKVKQVVQKVNSNTRIKFIAHNGKFDLNFARFHGMPYHDLYFDTLLADSIVDENKMHSLNIAAEYRGHDFGAYDTKLWPYTNKDEKKKKSYQHVPVPLLEYYLSIDLYAAKCIYLDQVEELKKEDLLDYFLNQKMKALKLVIETEFIGTRFNKKLILETHEILKAKINSLIERGRKVTGIADLNLGSDIQVLNYFYSKKYPFKKLNIRETKRGHSVDSETLKKFAKIEALAELPKIILTYKALTKLAGTYVAGKIDKVDQGEYGGFLQHLDSNDRVHTSFNLWTPRTGRYSSNRPSLQVFPRPLKGLPSIRNFIIPSVDPKTSEDWILFEADYSALEINVVAVESKDKKLISELQNNIDMHSNNAVALGRELNWLPDGVDYEMILVGTGKAEEVLTAKQIEEAQARINKLKEPIDFKELRNRSKCVHGSTRIPTSKGLLKIEDMVKNKDDGDWLQIIDFDVATSHQKQKAIRINHKWVDKQYVIRTKHGDIIGNDEHPLYVWRDCQIKEIKLKDIKVGDYLMKPRTSDLWADSYVKLHSDWWPHHFSEINQKKVKAWAASGKMLIPPKLPTELNEDLAFILGFLTAEGSGYDYSFTQKESEEVLGKMTKCIKSCFGYDPHYIKSKGNVSAHSWPTAIRHWFKNNEIVKQNANEVRVPEVIFRSPKSVVRAYLRAFFEGDGSGNKVEVSSFLLRNDLVKLLNNFNIFPTCYITWNTLPNKKAMRKYYGLRLESYEFSLFSKEIGFYSKRKNKKLKTKVGKDSRKLYGLEELLTSYKESYSNCKYSSINGRRLKLGEAVHSQDKCELTYNKLSSRPYVLESLKIIEEETGSNIYQDVKYLIDHNCQLSKVTNIRLIEGKHKNYDITVDHPDHNYIANGFLSKNSISFGLNYGKEAYTFAQDFNIPQDEAEDMIKAYFKKYSGMKSWRDSLVEKGLNNGYIALASGRKRRVNQAIDWIKSKYAEGIFNANKLKSEISRQLMNYPVQGGAHEVFEPAIIRLNDAFKENGLKARLLLLIHDGIVGECPRNEVDLVVKLMKEKMPVTYFKGKPLELFLKIDTDVYKYEWYGEKLD